MNKYYAWLGVLIAFSMQLWGVFMLFHFNHTGHDIAVWPILLYGFACVLYGQCGVSLLAKPYQKQGIASSLFLCLFALSMPVLGIVGSLIAVVVATHYPFAPDSDAIEEHQIPELPFEPDHVGLTPRYSRGGVTAILKHASAMDKRLFAIITTQNMTDKDAIPILKLALKDPDDDIRLLAYSSLDKRETAINEQIQIWQKRLNQLLDGDLGREPSGTEYLAGEHAAGDNLIGACHRQLAEKYWELSYLGLSQGALKHYVLEKAAFHAEQSLTLIPTIATQTLLGKIWLAIGHYEQAQQMFELAVQSGVPKLQTYPYLAEIAFHTKRYDLCQTYLAHLEDQNISANVKNIRAYWNDNGL